MSMAIPSTAAYNPSVSPTLNSALSSTLDVASMLTQFTSGLLQNLLAAKQQQYGQNPNLGTSGLGGTQGTGNTSGLGQNNGLGSVLQSMMELLQALVPLMQALGNRGMGGANQLANNVAGQLPGGMGGLGGMGGQSSFGQAQGIGSAFQPGLGMGGQTNFGQAQGIGNTYQQPMPQYVQQPQYVPQPQYVQQPFMPVDSFSVNAPAMLGNNTQQAALQWAQTYGGPNTLTQADITQGMNLYSIFNTGSRMF